MITCDRCHCEIEEGLIECVEAEIIDEDITDYIAEAEIHRFCPKCWNEMIRFLASEGMLI